MQSQIPTMKFRLSFIVILLATVCTAQISGCTDPASLNYNPLATINNGCCTYASTSISPDSSIALPTAVSESSGLLEWSNQLLTHNDNDDTSLYVINKINGEVEDTIALPGIVNRDWEEISQDADFIYIGDFGNNVSGNRANLRIYRIAKASLNDSPEIETIAFNYEDQQNLAAVPANTTEFDCEAFVVTDEFIYLFTKQWSTKHTSVYRMPKMPGSYIAHQVSTYNVQGLITGASYNAEKKLIALTGYSAFLQPFLFLLYDFEGDDFFGANKRKVSLALPFHQVESIASSDGIHFFLTNEKLMQQGLSVSAKLHTVDLTALIANYISEASLSMNPVQSGREIVWYDAINHNIRLSQTGDGSAYCLYDLTGREIRHGFLTNSSIDVSGTSPGLYWLKTTYDRGKNILIY